MLPILLSILKIIGIVVLCVLAFIIFLILLLLFCPFKYNINCAKKEGIIAKVGVFWLFHFLSVRVVYDKTLLILARVLGIKVFKKTMLEKSSEEKKDDKSDEVKDFDYFDDLEDIEKAEEIKDDIEISEKASEKVSKKISIETSENPSTESFDGEGEDLTDSTIKDDEEITADANSLDIQGTIDDMDEEEEKEKLDLSDRIDIVLDKISDFFEELPEKIEKPEQTVEEISDKISYYINLFGSKGAGDCIDFVKEEVFAILKSIRPRKGYIYIDYSSEDPEKAAKMFEIYGLLFPYLPKGSDINIGFDENHLEFEADIKGKIYLIVIVVHGLKLLLNKKLKHFVKLVKMEDKKDGRK